MLGRRAPDERRVSATRTRADRPPAARSAPVASPRPLRWLAGDLLGRTLRLAPLVALGGLGALGFSQLDALESMSPGELRERRPALRAAAELRAGGEVRGPRVLEAPGAFRLVYRRGRCRVVVTVDRSSPVFGAAEKGSVSLTSTGCRRRAGG